MSTLEYNRITSFSILPSDSLPRLVFEKRLACPSSKGIIPSICLLIESLSLPSLTDIFRGDWSRHAWKRLVRSTVLAIEYSSFLDSCHHLPLSSCLFRLGRPIPIGAKCPGTSGIVPDLELLSRVPHGTYFLADLSRKFCSTGLTNNYNLPITLVNSL